MKKKLLAAFMAAAMLLTGCSGNTSSGSSAANDASSTADNAASVKAGFVYIGKIDDGGYTRDSVSPMKQSTRIFLSSRRWALRPLTLRT